MTPTIYEVINNKARQNLAELEDELKAKKPEEILERSYEYAVKKEIVMYVLSDRNFIDTFPVQTQAMLAGCNNMLDWFYEYWLKHEDHLTEDLQDAIRYVVLHKNVAS